MTRKSHATDRGSAVRELLTTALDRHGAVSTQQIEHLCATTHDPLRRYARYMFPRTSEALIAVVVEQAFLDLHNELLTSAIARVRHSRTRAVRWLRRRVGRVLLHAVQLELQDSVGGDSAMPGCVLQDHRMVTRVMADLPRVEGYGASWPATIRFGRDLTASRRDVVRRYLRQCVGALRALRDPRCEIDHAGIVRRVNAPALRLLGLEEPAGILGQPIHDVLHPGIPVDEGLCPIHLTLALGNVYHMAHDEFRTTSGTRTVEYVSRPIVARRARRSSADVAQVCGARITFHDRTAWEARMLRRRTASGSPWTTGSTLGREGR